MNEEINSLINGLREANTSCRMVDETGTVWFKYHVEYTDTRQRNMSFELWATSDEDAQERLNDIKANGRISGRIREVVLPDSLAGEG